jgi:hypothetical protein
LAKNDIDQASRNNVAVNRENSSIHSDILGEGLKMKEHGKRRFHALATFLLVIAACFGVISAAFYGGLIPGFEFGGVYTHSPTATYSGYFSINYVGAYHYVQAVPVCRYAFPPCLSSGEAVFYMNAKNGTVRLVFYCGGLVKYYCESPSQLPFGDGTCLHVKGTLLEPSKWPTDQFTPSMRFTGDLYVFENETLPETSCS